MKRWFSAVCTGASGIALACAMALPSRAGSSVPDFHGVYGRKAHNSPKPYLTCGAARNSMTTDGYNNPILKPWVVELLPYVFGGTQIQILQCPRKSRRFSATPDTCGRFT